jgi:hypothetical protein
MTTMPTQRPSIAAGGVTPTFTQCTATDKFSVPTGSGRYLLYYKNAGTPTTTLWVLNPGAAVPAGSTPAVPTGATNFGDVLISAALGSSTERAYFIDDVSPYVDATNFVNLKHNTPTTLTMSVLGPF